MKKIKPRKERDNKETKKNYRWTKGKKKSNAKTC